MDDYDDYYYEDYVEDELDNAMFFCVLPVIEQVTAVFLKLFGLSAMVSYLFLFRKPFANYYHVQFCIFLLDV